LETGVDLNEWLALTSNAVEKYLTLIAVRYGQSVAIWALCPSERADPFAIALLHQCPGLTIRTPPSVCTGP